MPRWWRPSPISRRYRLFSSPGCGFTPCREPVSGRASAWWWRDRCSAGAPLAANKGLSVGGDERAVLLEDLQKVLDAAKRQTLFIVITHSLFHLITLKA